MRTTAQVKLMKETIDTVWMCGEDGCRICREKDTENGAFREKRGKPK